mgnify:CR=1 FL=1
MAVEYEISSDVATIKDVAPNTQVARVVSLYSGQITYDDEAGSKFATATIDGKSQRVMLCIAVNGTVNYDDVPSLYSTVDGHRCLNIVAPTETGTPDDVPSVCETVVIDGMNVRAVRCIMINKTPVYDGVSSTCTFTGDDGKTHTAQLVNKITGGSVEVIVKGVAPLSLPDAIANSLSYVKAFGGTEQRNIPAEYVENQFIYMLDGSYLVTDITPTTDIRIEMDFATTTVTASSAIYLGGRSEGAGSGIVVGHDSSKKIIFDCFDTRYTDESVVFSDNTRYKYSCNNGVVALYAGSTLVSSHTFTPSGTSTKTLAIKALQYNNGIAGNSDGMYLYSFKVWNAQGELVADYVPATLLNPLTVGIYDRVTGTHLTPTSGTWSAGPALQAPTPDRPIDIVSNNGVLKLLTSATGTGAQSGTPTPTSPIYPTFYQQGDMILRKVGNYADSYNATTHKITRNVGVKVLDGTEGWSKVNVNNVYQITITDKKVEKSTIYCSHFQYSTGTTSTIANNSIGCAGANSAIFIRNNAYTEATDFARWLSDQYAAGTPVTVYYPLATPVEEDWTTPIIYADGTVETILLNLIEETHKNWGIDSSGVVVGTSGVWGQIAKVEPNKKYYYKQINSNVVIGFFASKPELGSVTYDQSRTLTNLGYFTTPNDNSIKYVLLRTEQDSYIYDQSATAEMLLKVGDYQDVQSIIDGVVTRNVGVKVLDGTENWTLYGTGRFAIPLIGSKKQDGQQAPISSHFIGMSASNVPGYNGYMSVFNGSIAPTSGALGVNYQATLDVAQLKQWLADQYAAGTPVIVIYPLATPTTESVTGQTLQVQAGDNALEITQASLNNLELEAQYQAAVSLTIQEVQDANLDNNVTVTIQ